MMDDFKPDEVSFNDNVEPMVESGAVDFDANKVSMATDANELSMVMDVDSDANELSMSMAISE